MTCDGICKQVEEGNWHLLPELKNIQTNKKFKNPDQKMKIYVSATAVFKQDMKLPKCYLEISDIFVNLSVFMKWINYKSSCKRKYTVSLFSR